MTRDIVIGLDAGTSVIKAVAFDLTGKQLASAGVRNQYTTAPDGSALQDMNLTWDLASQVMRELSQKVPDLSKRARTMGVTAQGDGTWLIDADGQPVAPAMLWLDSRATRECRSIVQGAFHNRIYASTATGVNVCQMRTQLGWLRENAPETLNAAASALHCKEWLYYCLTGQAVADVSEAVLNFGDIATRNYSDEVISALGLEDLRHLLPPIVDGSKTAFPLSAKAAAQTGLPEGLPVCLGYMDIVTSTIAAGLCDPVVQPGLTILGSTGVHTRHAASAKDVTLNDDNTGYTVALAGEAFGQLQTNMAAAINIDWIAGIAREVLASSGVERATADILSGFDALVLRARPGATMYHPYIVSAGERGPFLEPDARASFTGLDQTVGWAEMVRGVYEGLALAARDCYSAMGPIPQEIRVAGGASRSVALLNILASVLDRPVRTVSQPETGAAGAAMIAAVQAGVFTTLEKATEVWVTPLLQEAVQPDSDLSATYETLFPTFQHSRRALLPLWQRQAQTKEKLK